MAKKKNESSKLYFYLFLTFSLLAIIFVLTTIGGSRKKQTRENTKSNQGCGYDDLSGVYAEGDNLAYFEGENVYVPKLAQDTNNDPVLGVAYPHEKWVEIDLSEQKLRAWDNGQLFLETPVSTGLPWTPTPTGEFWVWIKLRYTKMEGGQGDGYYYLPNVPYVMFYGNEQVPNWKGYSLHGTYWHSDFGNQRSHGCVNLPTPIAERIFYWIGPVLSQGKWVVKASEGNPGTRIVVHE